MSEKKIATWFAKRKESNVVKGAREHILKIVDVSEELNNAIAAMIEKSPEKAKQAIARLSMDEKAADNIEDSVREELARGDMDPKEREDLMHLVRRMDHIADWAKSAARNIEVLIEAKIEIPGNIWLLYKQITEKLVTATNTLKGCLDHMGEDDQKFVCELKKVADTEHAIDDLYFEARKQIIMTESLDPRVIFVLRDMIHAMENSADSCKSAADLLNILFVANR